MADRGCGYGLGVAVGEHAENNRPGDILISRIVHDSPAYRFYTATLNFSFIVCSNLFCLGVVVFKLATESSLLITRAI